MFFFLLVVEVDEMQKWNDTPTDLLDAFSPVKLAPASAAAERANKKWNAGRDKGRFYTKEIIWGEIYQLLALHFRSRLPHSLSAPTSER